VGRLAALSLAALAFLPGCFFSSRGATVYEPAEPPDALTNVRAAVPAIEAYFADNGTYDGLTLEFLRQRYDAGIPDVTIVADAATYCVESTAGDAAFHKAGPAAAILPGPCP
jgi:hypothetical protein